MENKFKKYYLTDVYNVVQEVKDGFTERKKKEIITEEVNGELREIFTKSKVFVVDGYQTFNSRPFLRSNASLYGTRKEEITYSDVLKKLESLSGDEIRNYIHEIIRLAKTTTNKALEDEEKLLFAEMSFIEKFNTPYEKLFEEPTIKHL